LSRALPGPSPSLLEVQGRIVSATSDGSDTSGSEPPDELPEAERLERLGLRPPGLGLPAHALAVEADHARPVLADPDAGRRAVDRRRAVARRRTLERRVEPVLEVEDPQLVHDPL